MDNGAPMLNRCVAGDRVADTLVIEIIDDVLVFRLIAQQVQLQVSEIGVPDVFQLCTDDPDAYIAVRGQVRDDPVQIRFAIQLQIQQWPQCKGRRRV